MSIEMIGAIIVIVAILAAVVLGALRLLDERDASLVLKEHGLLKEAVTAFYAIAKRNPGDVELTNSIFKEYITNPNILEDIQRVDDIVPNDYRYEPGSRIIGNNKQYLAFVELAASGVSAFISHQVSLPTSPQVIKAHPDIPATPDQYEINTVVTGTDGISGLTCAAQTGAGVPVATITQCAVIATDTPNQTATVKITWTQVHGTAVTPPLVSYTKYTLSTEVLSNIDLKTYFTTPVKTVTGSAATNDVYVMSNAPFNSVSSENVYNITGFGLTEASTSHSYNCTGNGTSTSCTVALTWTQPTGQAKHVPNSTINYTVLGTKTTASLSTPSYGYNSKTNIGTLNTIQRVIWDRGVGANWIIQNADFINLDSDCHTVSSGPDINTTSGCNYGNCHFDAVIYKVCGNPPKVRVDKMEMPMGFNQDTVDYSWDSFDYPSMSKCRFDYDKTLSALGYVANSISCSTRYTSTNNISCTVVDDVQDHQSGTPGKYNISVDGSCSDSIGTGLDIDYDYYIVNTRSVSNHISSASYNAYTVLNAGQPSVPATWAVKDAANAYYTWPNIKSVTGFICPTGSTCSAVAGDLTFSTPTFLASGRDMRVTMSWTRSFPSANAGSPQLASMTIVRNNPEVVTSAIASDKFGTPSITTMGNFFVAAEAQNLRSTLYYKQNRFILKSDINDDAVWAIVLDETTRQADTPMSSIIYNTTYNAYSEWDGIMRFVLYGVNNAVVPVNGMQFGATTPSAAVSGRIAKFIDQKFDNGMPLAPNSNMIAENIRTAAGFTCNTARTLVGGVYQNPATKAAFDTATYLSGSGPEEGCMLMFKALERQKK